MNQSHAKDAPRYHTRAGFLILLLQSIDPAAITVCSGLLRVSGAMSISSGDILSQAGILYLVISHPSWRSALILLSSCCRYTQGASIAFASVASVTEKGICKVCAALIIKLPALMSQNSSSSVAAHICGRSSKDFLQLCMAWVLPSQCIVVREVCVVTVST